MCFLKLFVGDLFKGKYRIPSTRLQYWDYSSDGCYFITICTKNREYFFGSIQSGLMILSKTGNIAKYYWHEIPNHFPFVRLDSFVVMPDHIHGILIIDHNGMAPVETPNLDVSTGVSSQTSYWKSGTLGVIINQYKRICTIASRKLISDFAWQPRFYDHIIRDDEELNRIRAYIANNQLQWELGKKEKRN